MTMTCLDCGKPHTDDDLALTTCRCSSLTKTTKGRGLLIRPKAAINPKPAPPFETTQEIPLVRPLSIDRGLNLKTAKLREEQAMLCQTIKQGTECFFMSKKGCTFNGGTCTPINKSCQGCSKTVTLPHGIYCQSYPNPEAKWKNGHCNLATHVKGGAEKVMKLNPLKASKRSQHR